MTRQEAKELDREIPWRQILAMPPAIVDKDLASLRKKLLLGKSGDRSVPGQVVEVPGASIPCSLQRQESWTGRDQSKMQSGFAWDMTTQTCSTSPGALLRQEE